MEAHLPGGGRSTTPADTAFRKLKLITEDVQGRNCITSLHAWILSVTNMIRTQQSTIKARVKTSYGCLLYLFHVRFITKLKILKLC